MEMISVGDMRRLELRGRIVAKFGTLTAFAAAAGITPTTVTNVLQGKTNPQRKKMAVWCELLDLKPEEKVYFFA